MTDEEGVYTASIQANTDQKALYAYTPYGDLVPAQRIELTGSDISMQWGSAPVPAQGAVYKTAVDSTFTCDPGLYQVKFEVLKKLDVVSGNYVTIGSASNNYNGIGFNPEDNLIYGFRRKAKTLSIYGVSRPMELRRISALFCLKSN